MKMLYADFDFLDPSERVTTSYAYRHRRPYCRDFIIRIKRHSSPCCYTVNLQLLIHPNEKEVSEKMTTESQIRLFVCSTSLLWQQLARQGLWNPFLSDEATWMVIGAVGLVQDCAACPSAAYQRTCNHNRSVPRIRGKLSTCEARITT